MSKRGREAERYFGRALRAPKTFVPKVETDYTRIVEEKNLAQFGFGFGVMLIGVFVVITLLDCLRFT